MLRILTLRIFISNAHYTTMENIFGRHMIMKAHMAAEQLTIWIRVVFISIGKPMAQSYGHGTESKTSIQPITMCKIIIKPIRMLSEYKQFSQHPYISAISKPPRMPLREGLSYEDQIQLSQEAQEELRWSQDDLFAWNFFSFSFL